MNKKLKHGKIMVYSADNTLITTGLKCETDFLARSELFTDCLSSICELLLEVDTDGGIAFVLDNLRADSKEQIELSCSSKIILKPNVITNYYLHHDERKIAIVELKSANDIKEAKQLAKDIAMHVVAFNPDYLCMDNVNWDQVDLEIPENMLNKPPSILEKIAKGKKIKYAKDHVLYNQPYAKDLKKTVGQIISEFNKEHKAKVEIADYCRMEV